MEETGERVSRDPFLQAGRDAFDRSEDPDRVPRMNRKGKQRIYLSQTIQVKSMELLFLSYTKSLVRETTCVCVYVCVGLMGALDG